MKSLLLCGVKGFLLPLASVSLVAPFLTDLLVGRDFPESLEVQLAH